MSIPLKLLNVAAPWLEELFLRYPALANARHSILKAVETLRNTFERGGKLIICGNGGSAADAEHICGELMKGFLKKRSLNFEFRTKLLAIGADSGWVDCLQIGLPVIPLTAASALGSAISNDLGDGLVFAQQVLALGKPGDTLLAISTSGCSANVIRAILVAKTLGMTTVGLTGGIGGELVALCDATIIAPGTLTYQIQEYHLPIYHSLCVILEEYFFVE